jgi:hypothetical protein
VQEPAEHVGRRTQGFGQQVELKEAAVDINHDGEP